MMGTSEFGLQPRGTCKWGELNLSIYGRCLVLQKPLGQCVWSEGQQVAPLKP